MNLGCQAAFAAVKAATNSASVEPDAVMVWVLLSHGVAPPKKVKTRPVIDLWFQSSWPQLASTKPIGLGCEMSTVNSPTTSGSGAQVPGGWDQAGCSKVDLLVCSV